jgi:hypothetical protein
LNNKILNKINKEFIYNIDNITISDYIKIIQYNKNIKYIFIINNNKESNIFKQAIDSYKKDKWYKVCLEENNKLLS